MSIIVLGSEQQVDEAGQGATRFAPALRDLLDHIAAELAAEYIRLMEAAAQTKNIRSSAGADDSLKETER